VEIIYDGEIDITIDGLFTLLLSKNKIAQRILKNEGWIEKGESSSTFIVFQHDKKMAGYFALLNKSPSNNRMQVCYADGLVGSYNYMILLNWMILETLKGREIADSWMNSRPGIITISKKKKIIMPILGYLLKIAMQRHMNAEIPSDLDEPHEWWEAKVANEDDRLIIKLLRKGEPPDEARRRLSIGTNKTILNRESDLRRSLGPEIVPFRTAWRNRKRQNK
jgi:hypothetical protein